MQIFTQMIYKGLMTSSYPLTTPQQPDKSILLVDDDQAVIEVTQEILEVLGHRVTIAANGRDALGHYINHKDDIDLVITDLDMPHMDGRTLVAALRADNPRLKIIIITGNRLEIENPDSPIYQVNRWLCKPYWLDDLVNALDAVA
jgi:CheY-like chemotaxis protein